MTYGIIYRLTNTINGKVYVGQTVLGVVQRLRCHRAAAAAGGDQAIYRAIRKYGFEAFSVDVIDEADDKPTLDEKECYWIAHFDSMVKGYNSTSGGESYRLSDEAKRKISEKLGAANKPPRSAEHCARISASKKGKPSSFKGKCHSPEVRARLSATKKGKPPSEKARLNGQKHWGYNKGVPMSEEQKRKVSETKRKLLGTPPEDPTDPLIPDKYRELVARVASGEPVCTAAVALGIKPNTARVVLQKHRARMKQRLTAQPSVGQLNLF